MNIPFQAARDRYWERTLRPLTLRFNGIIARPDLKKIYNEDKVRCSRTLTPVSRRPRFLDCPRAFKKGGQGCKRSLTSVRPHGLFCHAAVTVLRQIDTGRNRKYRNRNRRRNCGRMAPMRSGFDHLAAVTVTESAVTVTVREIAAAWGPCGHKIRPLRSCGTPTAWPQLKNFCRMMRPYHAAA